MVIDTGLRDYFARLAREHRTTIDDVVERALIGIALIRAARKRGLNHVGFVSDPSKLDAELRGLLPERPHIVMAR